MIYDSCIIYEKKRILNQHWVSFHNVGISIKMIQVTPVKKKIHRHKLLKVIKGFRIKSLKLLLSRLSDSQRRANVVTTMMVSNHLTGPNPEYD